MKLFEDLPSQNMPINAENLNQIQDNLVVVSATEPTGDNREKVWMQKGKNLFDIDTMVEFVGKHRAWDTGWFIAETGVYDGIKFPVKPNTNYAFSTDATEHLGIAYYDENFNYISGQSFPNGDVFTTPENCYFVTLAVKNDYTWIQVEYGSFITPYEAYVEQKIYVLNDNDVYEEFRKVDDTLNSNSTNAIQNQAVYNAIKNHSGYNGYATDLNNCLRTGTYAFNDNSINVPYSNAYGCIFVMVGGNVIFDSSAWWVHQLLFGTDGSVWTRFSTNGVNWAVWKQLS